MPVLTRFMVLAVLAAVAGCGGGDAASASTVSGIQAAADLSPDPAGIDDAETVVTTASTVLL
jgi:hypothetical protein